MSNPTKELKCEICLKPALGVASSRVGAMSYAICKECIEKGREPWGTLVGGLCGCRPHTVVEGVLEHIIRPTCEFYGKTEEEFWKEVIKLEDEFAEYMEKENE